MERVGLSEEKMLSKNIYLIGFMGTGKSTISKVLSEMTKSIEIDIDYEIVKKEKKAIAQIFELHGEAYFRNIETEIIRITTEQTGAIVSCGGGAVLKKENVALMKNSGIIVLLTATPETILSRIKNDKNRPLLNGNMTIEHISEMMNKRKVMYENAKDFEISTESKTEDEIAKEIVNRIV